MFSLVWPHVSVFGQFECGGTMTGTSGWIILPGTSLTGRYYSDLDCEWTITFDDWYMVRLEITEMNVEEDESCSLDYIEVIFNDSLIPLFHTGPESHELANISIRG